MSAFKGVVVEALGVAAGALALALVANAVSPRGLSLGRDYFPPVKTPPAAVALSTPKPVASADPAVVQRLAQRGLRVASADEVRAWLDSGQTAAGLVLLIDARPEAQFRAGHLPGARQFDHYHPEQSLPTVLPLCLVAQKVVVYCTGGTCEDSEFAALVLRDAGVPAERLCVFPGGIAEWTTRQFPLEAGAPGGATSPDR